MIHSAWVPGITSPLLQALPSLNRLSFETHGNVIRDAWDKLADKPGGRYAFSKLVGRMAPYTGSISAKVLDVGFGRAEVELREHKAIRNHIHSIHAIALANLAELAGNIGFVYGLPDDARFIVAGLEIDYLKKARGRLLATTSCPVPKTSERQEYLVPVEIRDESGEVVASARLRTLVGPKKS